MLGITPRRCITTSVSRVNSHASFVADSPTLSAIIIYYYSSADRFALDRAPLARTHIPSSLCAYVKLHILHVTQYKQRRRTVLRPRVCVKSKYEAHYYTGESELLRFTPPYNIDGRRGDPVGRGRCSCFDGQIERTRIGGAG